MHVSTSHQWFPLISLEQVASSLRWHYTAHHCTIALGACLLARHRQNIQQQPLHHRCVVVCRSSPSPSSSWREQRASPACSTIEISPKRASSVVRMRLRRDGDLVRDSLKATPPLLYTIAAPSIKHDLVNARDPLLLACRLVRARPPNHHGSSQQQRPLLHASNLPSSQNKSR